MYMFFYIYINLCNIADYVPYENTFENFIILLLQDPVTSSNRTILSHVQAVLSDFM